MVQEQNRNQNPISQSDATQLEQERQQWQREKEAYQRLCEWYANSPRYQLGGLLIDALRHPSHLFKFPILAYRVYKQYCVQNSSEADVESSIKVSNDQATQWEMLPFSAIECALDNLANHKITIIVPIYNACDQLRECVRSIIENTDFPYQLYLLDDCSTEASISEYLRDCAQAEQVTVLTHTENKGYIHTINEGIERCDTDVVILNSDTKVTPGWLRKLAIAAYSNPKSMTVTPCSNAAGVFSVPAMNQDNILPDGMNLWEVARIIERLAPYPHENVPTGNGFCMYIKREAFDLVGLFDEKTFGRGYCEENDFCLKLLQKGYQNAFCRDTYIFHYHSASFQKKKSKILEENMRILNDRYPQYSFLVDEMLHSSSFTTFGKKATDAMEQYNSYPVIPTRILYVIQAEGGGSVKANEDLMGYIEKQDYDVYLLNSDCETLRLFHYQNANLTLMQEWHPTQSWDINRLYDEEWKEIYFNVIFQLHINIVHIRHLYKHTFDVVDVAKWLHIPVLLSFHDFYYICPTINLIGGDGRYCNADCALAESNCKISVPHIHIEKGAKKWVTDYWRPQVNALLSKSDGFITTSQYSRALYERIYPQTENRFHVIEHGRDFAYERKFYGQAPSPEQKIRILLAGNINHNKGADYIESLIKSDEQKKLEFHCIGIIPETLKTSVIYHGKYLRDDFNDYVQRIKPSYVGIFSVWPETYCHILTEAFSCGIPCIVSDIGTLRERGLDGGCILADLANPRETCEKIYKISANPTAYSRLCEQACTRKLRTVAEMGADYKRLYESL